MRLPPLREVAGSPDECVEENCVASGGRSAVPEGLSSDSTSSSRLSLSLSNEAALEVPIGEMIAEWLAGRISLEPSVRSDIALVVHEAVLNAVIHGHLALPDAGRTSFAGATDFEKELERHLDDPSSEDQKCEIRVRWNAACIFVSVSDHGTGFVPTASDDATLPWGRGMRLMQALSSRCRWMNGGRKVLIRFAR